ncbi:hypothetical protein [Vannielia litorea]|uniref:hypothetical protein n=1 Tax=Vannielia litorea TaxID=1217970 RepID=UPI001C96E643|nr:hypothetical protein [Vannielia litorea]MBY6046900.1 hypothetical protein [Vannielia litorea]MBY6074314.1 hypothetical protein [Vannielia litorea]
MIRTAFTLCATLAAAPLAAQSFQSPDCPTGSTRTGNECTAPNGIVTQRFVLPQITDEADDGRVVYNLSSDSPSGLRSTGESDRVVIRENSLFVTDLDADLTVIAD